MSQVTTLLSFVLLHRVYMRKTHTYFSIQNKLHWDIYMLLRSRTISEKLPKFPVFGTCFIHHLQLPGSQRHSKSDAF